MNRSRRRRLVPLLALLVATGALSGPAEAQPTGDWTSPSGTVTVTIPEGWVSLPPYTPNVLMAVKSTETYSDFSVVGCSVERQVIAEGAAFTRAQANALTHVASESLFIHTRDPEFEVQGLGDVATVSFEVTTEDAPASERDFGILFLMPGTNNLVRYRVLCIVYPGLPTSASNAAVARQFVNSVRINAETEP